MRATVFVFAFSLLAGGENALACGLSPSTHPPILDAMHADDEAGLLAGDIVFRGRLNARLERFPDQIDYEVLPLEVIVGPPISDVLASPVRLSTSCGPLPHFYLDWDRDFFVGGVVVVRASILPDGLVMKQIASEWTLDGNRLLDLARRPAGDPSNKQTNLDVQ